MKDQDVKQTVYKHILISDGYPTKQCLNLTHHNIQYSASLILRSQMYVPVLRSLAEAVDSPAVLVMISVCWRLD